MHRNEPSTVRATNSAAKVDRVFEAERRKGRAWAKSLKDRAPNPDWQTAVKDEAGNIIGWRQGFERSTPEKPAVAVPAVKPYEPQAVDKSAARRARWWRKHGKVDHPIWLKEDK